MEQKNFKLPGGRNLTIVLCGLSARHYHGIAYEAEAVCVPAYPGTETEFVNLCEEIIVTELDLDKDHYVLGWRGYETVAAGKSYTRSIIDLLH